MTGPANHDPTNGRDEYEDLDSDRAVEDAIEYFDEPSQNGLSGRRRRRSTAWLNTILGPAGLRQASAT